MWLPAYAFGAVLTCAAATFAAGFPSAVDTWVCTVLVLSQGVSTGEDLALEVVILSVVGCLSPNRPQVCCAAPALPMWLLPRNDCQVLVHGHIHCVVHMCRMQR